MTTTPPPVDAPASTSAAISPTPPASTSAAIAAPGVDRPRAKPSSALAVLGALLFWPTNLFLVTLTLFGLTPLILVEMLADAGEGLVPWTFALGTLLLALVPLACTVGGMMLVGKQRSGDVLGLLVGVEVPALWLLGTRTFGMQELTGGAAVGITAAVLGLAALLVQVLRPLELDEHVWRRRAVHAFTSLLVPVGAWVLLVLGSLGAAALIDIVDDAAFTTNPSRLLFGAGLWCAAATFLLTPLLGPVLWWRAVWRGAARLSRVDGAAIAVATTLGPIVAVVGALLAMPAPGAPTLLRLAHAPSSDAERRALLDDREAIRVGLVDAALVAHRYPIGARDRVWHQATRDIVGEEAASSLDDFMRTLAAPFVFDGDRYEAAQEARRLYRAFFGVELERAERESVLHAMSATYTREERFAGLINEGEQRVRLVKQTVTANATDAGLVAVEIHDEWSNLTPTDLEVLLSFSLPPHAAVTGLWLNTEDDKANAFAFALAPRGAAQQVYREQVARRVDPALLEQVGPQQYRLRVFPVPARAIDDHRGLFGFRNVDSWRSTAGKHAHVWLTYEVRAGADGRVPTPRLLEARNAFFDDDAQRTVQGVHVDNSDTWVAGVPTVTPQKAAASMWQLADGHCIEVGAVAAKATPAVFDGKRVDVVIDRSIEVEQLQDGLRSVINALDGNSTTAAFETVWTSGGLRGEGATRATGLPDVSTLLPFGSTTLKQMVQQAADLPRLDGAAPDVVMVLAGRGSFESSDDAPLRRSVPGPMVLVLHLGALPTGYDDAVTDAISQSGGLITTDLAALLTHAQSTERLVVDGLGAAFVPCTGTPSKAPAFVARLAVSLLDRQRVRSDASTLDALHAIARAVPVVTPYSSMIVLVDEAQRERLRQLEQQDDRFDREVESGQQGDPATVVGTPEPAEVLLVVLAIAMLWWARRARPHLA
jgi:putative PEP-CTERM system integral membrane protein